MSNFSPRLEDSTDKQLLDLLDRASPGHAALASDELTRRSLDKQRKTMIDLDESNKQYSKIIGLFAIVQIIIAVLQLVLSIKESTDKVLSVFIGLVFISMIVILTKLVDKIMIKK